MDSNDTTPLPPPITLTDPVGNLPLYVRLAKNLRELATRGNSLAVRKACRELGDQYARLAPGISSPPVLEGRYWSHHFHA